MCWCDIFTITFPLFQPSLVFCLRSFVGLFSFLCTVVRSIRRGSKTPPFNMSSRFAWLNVIYCHWCRSLDECVEYEKRANTLRPPYESARSTVEQSIGIRSFHFRCALLWLRASPALPCFTFFFNFFSSSSSLNSCFSVLFWQMWEKTITTLSLETIKDAAPSDGWEGWALCL